jgi:hypothetical protein
LFELAGGKPDEIRGAFAQWQQKRRYRLCGTDGPLPVIVAPSEGGNPPVAQMAVKFERLKCEHFERVEQRSLIARRDEVWRITQPSRAQTFEFKKIRLSNGHWSEVYIVSPAAKPNMLAVIHPAGLLLKLAVFAAPTIKPDIGRTAIMHRLTSDARPDTRKNLAARLWDFVAAFNAVDFALACGQIRTRPEDGVHDGIVDLLLYRPIGRPPVCHCCIPNFKDSREDDIGMTVGRLKITIGKSPILKPGQQFDLLRGEFFLRENVLCA